MVDNRPHYTHAEDRKRPQEHQQHIRWRTDHIMHTLRTEKATGASAAHKVDNRPHHTHAKGRIRPQEHQQHIWWRIDHITHMLKTEQGHRSISSTYGGE
jgi:hypothetical protein